MAHACERDRSAVINSKDFDWNSLEPAGIRCQPSREGGTLIRSRKIKTKLGIFVVVVTAICSGCFTTIKTVDEGKEQAKAERFVVRFHDLYNASRFEEIYNLLDDSVRSSVNKEEFSTALQQTFTKWGKVRESKLSEAKVFFENPVQVRAIYNITYEKGQGQEWFITNIRGEDARLVEYTNAEGSDRP